MAATPKTDSKSDKTHFQWSTVISLVDDMVLQATTKLDDISDAGSSISIGNMFDMQLLMNRLSQMSEMSTNVMSAANSAATSFARNTK